MALGLLGFLVAATGAALAQTATGSVSLAVECEGGPAATRLTFTFKNTGGEDTALLLGAVLGNGRTYLLNGLVLHIRESRDQQLNRYEYWPRYYPTGGMGGGVGEWIQPIPVHGSFTMTADAEEFMRRFRRSPYFAGELFLELEVKQPQTTGLRVLTLFTGTLRSNQIRVPEQCK